MKVRINYNLAIFDLIYSAIILLFLSRDSFLFDVYGRADSACFFMCGKAWMNGMIPYVEFSDSKGPFLWLIYGLGYLIDNYSYIGVYFLSILALCITLFFLQKIAFIFLKDKKKGIVASILVLFALFNPLIHYETRAETFCWPFVTISLYLSLRVLFCRNTLSFRQLFTLSFVGGICFCACLLIKFTISIMLIICWIYVILNDRHSLSSICKTVFSFLGGICFFAFPFFIYMISNNCLKPCIQEYFLCTTGTVVQKKGLFDLLSNYFSDLQHLFGYGYNAQIYLLFLGSVILFSVFLRQKGNSFLQYSFPTVSYLWFLGISSMHANWSYYYECCSLFGIFLAIFLFQILSSSIVFTRIRVLTISILLFFVLILIDTPYKDPCFVTQRQSLYSLYAYSELTKQIESPKIVNFAMEIGVGITANSLPACRYWTRQNGESPKMLEERLLSISSHKADFVVIPKDSSWLKPMNVSSLNQILSENGYVAYNLPDDVVTVYSKSSISIPNTIRVPSKWDVITKKNIYALKNDK